jgi:hypothetical protein
MWFELTALAGEGEALVEHGQAFVAEHGNARLVDQGPDNECDVRRVYVVVDGGDIAGAVRGGPAATAAVATAKTLVDRLFMFYPALVAEPGGQRSA